MSIELVRFFPSKHCYAIDWSTFKVKETKYGNTVSVKAIWVTRKNSRTRVHYGALTGYSYKDKQDFMQRFDSRYGGSPQAIWDGKVLWNCRDYTPKEIYEMSEYLDPILKALPRRPEGFEGWYSI